MVELLLAHADWQPGSRYVAAGMPADARPSHVAGHGLEMQSLRCLAQTPTEQIDRIIDGNHPEPERRRALEIYASLRDQALAHPIDPEPGYRARYLDLLDNPLREGVRGILEQHFTPAPPKSYEDRLLRTRLLSDWITEPLRRSIGVQRVRAEPSTRDRSGALQPRPGAAPVVLSDHELDPIRALIPDPEPALTPAPDGRLLRVAETLLDGSELAYLTECVQDNWISSSGPFVERFERAFAAAVDCRFAIACSSGTAALHLASAAAGLGPDDEVLVPAFTMVATANAARYVGAAPVLVDSDPLTWNIDPERLVDKLTSRTRAVIAVHTYGQPADIEAIVEFARGNGLVVIEDAAEAHGARVHDRPVGGLGDVAAFSLYGNKILTTGEGGVVTTNDERIARSARELRDHAFSAERHFWHRRVGFNYRMTNLQAAIGLAQAERLEQLVARRMEVAGIYRRLLSDTDGLELPPELDGGVMWMFGVLISEQFGIGRDELRRRLAASGVETRTFFVPLHLQPAYQRSFAGQRYPVAERLGATGLYLPSSPRLSEDDIAYVADAIRAAGRAQETAGSPSSA
jgi:perosamine synthetase